VVDGVAEGIAIDEGLLARPVRVVRAAEQDADAEVDLDEIGGHQLAVDHDAGRHEGGPPPVGHVAVVVVHDLGILERPPAGQQRAPQADLLVAGQRLVEEVEDVVVERHRPLDEVEHAHEP